MLHLGILLGIPELVQVYRWSRVKSRPSPIDKNRLHSLGLLKPQGMPMLMMQRIYWKAEEIIWRTKENTLTTVKSGK